MATEPAPQVGPRAAWRLISSRGFGPYFVGNATSASGTWFHNLAASLLIFRLTHSALLLGVLNFSQFAAVLLLAPWTGGAADRLDRRRLLLVTQGAATVLSATLAAVAFAGAAGTVVVILFTLGLGVSSAFAAPSQLALIAQLVEPRDLPTAVGLNSMTYNLARAVGPVLAAASVGTLGIPASFAINSGSYLVLVLGLLVVDPRPQRRAAAPKLRESLELVLREPRLLALLLVVAAVGYGSDPVNTLAPAWAVEFGRHDTVGGIVVGVFGAGAVAAAVFLAGRTGSRERLVLTLVLLGGAMICVAASPWLPLAFVFLFVAGFGYLASNAAATTRLQLGVEEAHRGRIMALWSIAFLGLRPIASLTDGAIAALAGVRVAGAVLALPALAAAAVLACAGRRTLRR